MPIHFPKLRFLSLAAALVLTATQAAATWSILIVDTRTGEIAVASATCVERINLQRETPVLITGVGAVTAQSAVDSTGRNRLLIRDRLLEGVPLADIFNELAATDAGHANRQYGMIDTSGDTLTYSGIENAAWAGGHTGRIEMGIPGPQDDLVYAVQGNILSGENVVQAAVNAIVITEGDLADRLMAAMLAARFDGGDGRCSCNNTAPTACGSPPPAPFKSAHVGYMLVARLGDMDAARARYTVTGRATGFAFPDTNNNGIADIVCSWTVGTEIKRFENPTAPGSPLTFARETQGIEIGVANHRRLVQCDLNNDGIADFAVIANSPKSVAAVLGDGLGGYSPPMILALDNTPTGLTFGDLDGSGRDQLVVAVGSSNRVHTVALNGAGTAIEITQTASVPGSPRGITLAYLDSDSILDLAATQRTDSTVWIGAGTGNGAFTFAQTIADNNQPVAIESADLNNDGLADLVVVSDAGRRAGVHLHNADHSFTTAIPIELGATGNSLALGDVTGDGEIDLLVMTDATQQMLVYRNDGQANFAHHFQIRIGGGADTIALADLNNNATLDVYSSSTNSGALSILDNLGDGTFPPSKGFAMGEYFLTLNIDNQRLNDPDPVDQLAALFADWQASKVGIVDAVQSAVAVPSRVEQGALFSIVVELNDRQTTPVAASTVEIQATAEGGLVQLDSITQTGNNEYTLVLAADAAIGSDMIVIHTLQSGQKIRLMPDTPVWVIENIADFDANGMLDIFDVFAFLTAFHAGDLATDLDGSGTIEINDAMIYLNRYLEG